MDLSQNSELWAIAIVSGIYGVFFGGFFLLKWIVEGLANRGKDGG